VLSDFGVSIKLPAQYPKDFSTAFQTISAYRNAMLHNPVLGRIEKLGAEFLPTESVLSGCLNSWNAIEVLKESQFVNSRTLFTGLATRAAQDLNERWGEVIKALDGLRSNNDKFIKMLLANGVSEIAKAPIVATTVQPITASGNFIPTKEDY
jgi:hypothetical protein